MEFQMPERDSNYVEKATEAILFPLLPPAFFFNKPKPLEVNFEMFDRRAKWSTRADLKFPRGQTGPALGPRRRAVSTRTGKRDPKKSPPAGARPRVSTFDLAAFPPTNAKGKSRRTGMCNFLKRTWSSSVTHKISGPACHASSYVACPPNV